MNKEGAVLTFPSSEKQAKISTLDDRIELMSTLVEPGLRKFDNLSYPVTVLPGSEIFNCITDAVGNKAWEARFYLLGRHEGIGARNPDPWTGGEETVVFSSISSTIWEEGVFSSLGSSQNFRSALGHYREAKGNKAAMEIVDKTYQQIREIRERRRQEPVTIFVTETQAAAD